MNAFDWKKWNGEYASLWVAHELDASGIERSAEHAADAVRAQFADVLDQVDSPIELRLLIEIATLDESGPFSFPRDVRIIRADTGFKTRIYSRVEDSWLTIELQKPVGKYRCDMMVTWSVYTSAGVAGASICIEADGHDFHEKTKEQARHDKQRDRFFVSKGLRVLRFTGSEIHRSATKCAAEVLELLAGLAVVATHEMLAAEDAANKNNRDRK